MSNAFTPRHLHIVAFAKGQGTLAGEEKLATFDRLMEESQGLGGEAWVSFSARGSVKPDAAGVDESWVHLSAQTTLSMVCQRCLGAVDVQVGFARDFRFVASEELAEVEDEESEEDVLVASKSFDLLQLIEDELLMASPLVPMHEECPKPVKLVASDADFDGQSEERPNPFAVLQQLKKADPQ
jgi:uncharacterized protein